MPVQVPDLDIATFVDANDVALTFGTNLFRGKVRAHDKSGFIPVNSVWVLSSGGRATETWLRANASNRRFFQSTVQVRIRSNQREFLTGQTQAVGLRDLLHDAVIVNYISVKTNESEPIYLSEDNDGIHHWSLNLTLMFTDPAS